MNRKLLPGVLLLLLLVQHALPGQTNWKGFEKVRFSFQGRDAWYVKPREPLQGNPWVWRAHFPDWHTEMDSLLLSRGFHIAYVNTNDLFGHPVAMQVWDAFYDHLVNEKGFAPKVALEAVSRGGLYAYGWAKRNPWRVSCIYAEAPVCDPRSWPGGKGNGKGAPAEWDKWKQLYGLSEAGAAAFSDIPLNDLAGLAAFRVPVLHVISPKDEVVPNDENTELLIRNYIRAGGPATVYTMTRDVRNNGHHFTIENPALFADFIQKFSYPVTPVIPASRYVENPGRLSGVFRKFTTSKKGTVAFLGGSITHNPGWRDKVTRYLRERFPDTDFTFIPAGIPSLGSTPHAFRFGRDVLEKGIPDLLFLESAVNDRGNGFDEKAQVRALEGICRQLYRANPEAGIVMMAFADPQKSEDYAQGKEPVEVDVHRRVARHYNAAFINLAREIYDRLQAGEFSWKYDFKDLHPSPYGQELYFRTIRTLLSSSDGTSGPSALPMPAGMDAYSYEKASYMPLTQAGHLRGFELVPSWKPRNKVSTRPGFVEVPMLVTEHAGASLEFPFKGRAVGIAIISGPDAGIISYSIDGKPAREVDLFTHWSPQLHLPWYIMLNDGLKAGNHKLKLSVLPAKNPKSEGNACRIVHFLVAE